MRSPSHWTLVAASAFAATLGPLDATAMDVRARSGIPNVSFANGGAQLTRNFAVTLDSSLVAIDVSAPFCARASNGAIAADCEPNRPGARPWLDEHTASATLKVPQWHADAPYVDISIRTWRGDNGHDRTAHALHETTADVEITQPIGRYDLVAGYSYPLGFSPSVDRWRTDWIGTTIYASKQTTLRLLYESSRNDATGARDSRYAVRLTRAVSGALRMSAYISHSPDDFEQRWRAGVGIDWTF